jgi:hypothetical protein
MNRLKLPALRPSALVVATAVMIGLPLDARAGLKINAKFTGGHAPHNMAGGGDLVTIFNTAISYWEAAFSDPREEWVVNLEFQWADLGGNNGQFVIGEQGGYPHRIQSGTILFNNNGEIHFFADPTPYDNSEYVRYKATTTETPVGLLNVGRVFSRPRGDAVGHTDLLTIAEHEIGHALGLAVGNTASPSEFVVTPPRPFAGLEIYTQLGDHLASSTAVMGRIWQDTGERVLISGLDVLADAQISQFANPNLDPYAAPWCNSSGLMTSRPGAVTDRAAVRRRQPPRPKASIRRPK